MSKSLNLRRLRPRPPASTAPDETGPDEAATERSIARINELTRVGRGNWFGLLAYLAFLAITVLSVQDADFFIDSRRTQLPLIGVSIPTFAVFTVAPLLGAALHVYLHLLIRKSSEELAAIAPTYKGAPVERSLHPWLLNDLILRRRKDRALACPPRPMDWLAGVTAMLLIWFAAPYVLVFAWIRSIAAHDTGLSALIALCTFFCVYASLSTWAKATADLHRPWLAGGPASVLVFLLAATFLALHLLLTVMTTEGGLNRLTDPARQPPWAAHPWAAPALDALAAAHPPVWLREDRLLARADLAGAMFAKLPPEATDPLAARARFRAEWCQRQALGAPVCGPAETPADRVPRWLGEARAEWCAAHDLPASGCTGYFLRLDDVFEREWTGYRAQVIDALPKPDLSGRDLRRADLHSAALVGVRLDGALLDEADLSGADLQGTSLRAASLRNVRAGATDFFGADLEDADFSDADLGRARLDHARALGTQFPGALLGAASLAAADLRGANFTGASLHRADLQGAQLANARFAGASLIAADLRWTALQATRFDGATLGATDLRGATALRPVDIAGTLGGALTLLPEDAEFFTCSCWRQPPANWDDLVRADLRRTGVINDLKRTLLCAPGETPQRTGTPWPADMPPPWGDLPSSSRPAQSWAAAQGNRGECP